ncbi:MAG: hypothetical protein JWM10_3261, partial [Myxococcaceae bacterium]|nr:hypothetical protein [Myxococcaceae bacterium]
MDPDDLVVADVTVQRRWRRRLWPVPWLLALVLLGGAAAEWPAWALAQLAVLFVASLVAVLATVRGAGTTVRVGDGGLRLTDARGEKVLARSAIRRALVVMDGAGIALGVEPKVGSFVELVLPNPGPEALETAERCVERLGFGTDRRVLVFTNPTALVRTGVTGLLGAGLSVICWACAFFWTGSTSLPIAAAATALAAWLFARDLRTTDLAVGADGVELRGPWRTEFIGYDAFERTHWVPPATLEFGGASGVARPVLGTSLIDDPAMAEAFEHAVDRAKRRYDARRRGAVIATLLERRGRPLAEWRDSL